MHPLKRSNSSDFDDTELCSMMRQLEESPAWHQVRKAILGSIEIHLQELVQGKERDDIHRGAIQALQWAATLPQALIEQERQKRANSKR
jgi:hypothetical protein